MFQRILIILMRTPNYWRAFGFLKGSYLLLKLESKTSSTSKRVMKIQLSHQNTPIYLRERRSDCSIFWQIFVQKQYKLDTFPHYEKIREQYESILHSGNTPVIIDGGANIGLSVLFYTSIFPKAKIIAVEPSDKNYEMLRLNTQSFKDRIIPVNAGIWSRNSHLKVSNFEGGDAGLQVVETNSDNPEAVAGHDIPTLTEMAGPNASLFLVKLDIEGSQKHLFENNTEWVTDTPLISIELEDWLLPWTATSTNFFKATHKIPSDYLISGENLVWVNHKINNVT